MTFILHKIAVNSIFRDIFCAFSIGAPYHFYRKNESISIYAYKKRGNHYESKFMHTYQKMNKFWDSAVGHLEKGPPFCFLRGQDHFWKKSIIENICAKSLACINIWSISMIHMQLAAGLETVALQKKWMQFSSSFIKSKPGYCKKSVTWAFQVNRHIIGVVKGWGILCKISRHIVGVVKRWGILCKMSSNYALNICLITFAWKLHQFVDIAAIIS